ncbi:MAG: glutathione S-transferase [Polymorphobacter sp.]
MTPTLYSFRRCPYAIRARMALIISGTPFDLVEVRLSAKPEALLAASPKGTVPVLMLPDGHVIDESLDIMHWALARHDPANWLAGIDEPRIATNDGAFKYHLDRTKYPQRHSSDPVVHRAAGLTILAGIEAHLANRRQLGGDTPGFTDIAVFPFVRQFAAIDPSWFGAQPLRHVQHWLAGHLASPLFTAAMAR